MSPNAANSEPAGGSLFAARRVGHVNHYVDSLEASMNFYREVVGLEEVYRTPASGGGFLSNGNTHHDIGFIEASGGVARARGARPGTLNHVGFELDTERALVDAWERARAAGLSFLRTMDHDISHSVYNTDPEGNVYELYADVVSDWRSHRSGIVTKPKPDWWPGATPPVAERCWHAEPSIRRVDQALFHPQRTTHATFVVRDLEAMVAHYESIVGLRVLARGANGGFAVLCGQSGEPCLVLIRVSDTLAAGFHHVGLRVSGLEDLARSVERARAAALPVEVDIRDGQRRAVILRDPDGLAVQLYADDGEGTDLASIDPDFAHYLL
jgi:catechol 2,3-dioxygenase